MGPTSKGREGRGKEGGEGDAEETSHCFLLLEIPTTFHNIQGPYSRGPLDPGIYYMQHRQVGLVRRQLARTITT